MEESIEYICRVCGNKFPVLDSYRKHCSRVHKISSEQLYIENICNGIRHTCKCGCADVEA